MPSISMGLFQVVRIPWVGVGTFELKSSNWKSGLLAGKGWSHIYAYHV